MCGINAIFRPDGVSPEDVSRVRRMCAEMTYRGPDGDGFWNGGKCALGMVRLSIVGGDSGIQPIFSEDRNLVLVCNGEIYNHAELRSRLEAKGHVFATSSDCEVIVHLYEDMGPQCLHELRGMFAIALYDVRTRTLFAARDRIGERPLYFAEKNGCVGFSSEAKALFGALFEKASVNGNVLGQLALYSYPVDNRNTLVDGIRRVLPGEFLLVSEQGIRHERYWQPDFTTTFEGSYDEAVEAVRAELRNAVDLCFESSVPLAILLSSGVDSSGLAAIAAETGREIHAITVGYSGEYGCDERKAAKAFTAQFPNMVHHEIELNAAEFLSTQQMLIEYLDEPVPDASMVSQWILCKKAREMGFKILISGLGGDELFFGYGSHNEEIHTCHLKNLMDRRLARSVSAKLAAASLESYAGIARRRHKMYGRPNLTFTATTGTPADRQLAAPWHSDSFADPLLDIFTRMENGLDTLSQALVSTWLPNNCLYMADRLGLGNSIEIRVPYLDYKLVELAFSLPVAWRFSPGKPKRLLKDVLRKSLTHEQIYGEKKPFAPPFDFVGSMIGSTPKNVFANRHRYYSSALLDRFITMRQRQCLPGSIDTMHPATS